MKRIPPALLPSAVVILSLALASIARTQTVYTKMLIGPVDSANGGNAIGLPIAVRLQGFNKDTTFV